MVSIEIDELTECLIMRATGKEVSTSYTSIEDIPKDVIDKMHIEGWSKNFDWHDVTKHYPVYASFADNDERIQGLVGMRPVEKDLYVYVPLVESAPWNRGSCGEYIGVGGHLFAIACKKSFECGFDGFIAFESKTDLVEYYHNMLGAKVISSGVPVRMFLDTEASKTLVDRYFKEVHYEKGRKGKYF